MRKLTSAIVWRDEEEEQEGINDLKDESAPLKCDESGIVSFIIYFTN